MDNFNDEYLFESLVLESTIKYSDRFLSVIKSIKNSPISDSLLKIEKDQEDLKLVQNYIDLTPNKDEVSFIQDNKAQQILNGKWVTNYHCKRKYLTHSSRNSAILKRLGYDIIHNELHIPEEGEMGVILSETRSTTGKEYALFLSDTTKKKTVLSKDALNCDINLDDVWVKNRNIIKIGRFVRSLLVLSGISFSEKELENFVNDFKSEYDLYLNGFIRFKIVEQSIDVYYHHGKYAGQYGSLGNSCMRYNECGDGDFFDIYKYNKNCRLLILFEGDNTTTKEEIHHKWLIGDDKICGRALIWNTDQGDIFMDRIYTNDDSDVQLFKKYAETNGWWYKVSQNSDMDELVTNGRDKKSPHYTVSLEDSNWDAYPYVDTLCYLNKSLNKISNESINGNDDLMRDTEGGLD